MLGKICILKIFKNYKSINEFVSFNVADSAQRALKEELGTQKALQGHSKGTREIRLLKGTWVLVHLRHLGKHLRHSGTLWVLGLSKGTQALGHLGTQGTRGTLCRRLCV